MDEPVKNFDKLQDGYETGYAIKDGYVHVPIDEFQKSCVVVTCFCNINKARQMHKCFKGTRLAGMIATALSEDFGTDCTDICKNFRCDLYEDFAEEWR